MTFYKELEKALDNEGKGAFVLVEKNGGEYYCIFSPIKDSFGNYRDSGWCITEEEAKEEIGRYDGYTDTIINKRAKEECWEIIKTYSLKDLIY